MLRQIGEGSARVHSACELARSMVADGTVPQAVQGLASLGAQGMYPANEERDLFRWTANAFGFHLEPYFLTLDLDEPGQLELKRQQVPVLIPYEITDAIWKYSERQFRISFLDAASENAAGTFWEHARSQEWGLRHPEVQRRAGAGATSGQGLDRLLPVVYHVDGAEIHRNSEHYIWSWQSLLSKGNVWDTKFLLVAIPHAKMRRQSTKRGVFKQVTEFIAWQQKVWQRGRAPFYGFYGELLSGARAQLAGCLLAGGWCATFAGLKNDGKARKEIHFFKRHYSATYCCDSCLATQAFPKAPKQFFYGDFGQNAAYRTTLITHDTYADYEHDPSPWMSVDGWRLDLNYWDLLHVLFLGNSRHANASCICELLEHGLVPGGTAEARLAWLTRECKEWCVRRGIKPVRSPFSLQSLGRQSAGEFPEMASYYKGMEVKTLCFWLSDLAWALHDGSLRSKFRSTCMHAMAKFLRVLDHAGAILTEAEVFSARRAGRLYLQTYQWLAVHTEERGESLWPLRPKMHYLDHVIEHQLPTRINPKICQCDDDETFMNTMKRIGSKCHGLSVMRRQVQRYVLALSIRLHTRKQQGCLSLRAGC